MEHEFYGSMSSMGAWVLWEHEFY